MRNFISKPGLLIIIFILTFGLTSVQKEAQANEKALKKMLKLKAEKVFSKNWLYSNAIKAAKTEENGGISEREQYEKESFQKVLNNYFRQYPEAQSFEAHELENYEKYFKSKIELTKSKTIRELITEEARSAFPHYIYSSRAKKDRTRESILQTAFHKYKKQYDPGYKLSENDFIIFSLEAAEILNQISQYLQISHCNGGPYSLKLPRGKETSFISDIRELINDTFNREKPSYLEYLPSETLTSMLEEGHPELARINKHFNNAYNDTKTAKTIRAIRDLTDQILECADPEKIHRLTNQLQAAKIWLREKRPDLFEKLNIDLEPKALFGDALASRFNTLESEPIIAEFIESSSPIFLNPAEAAYPLPDTLAEHTYRLKSGACLMGIPIGEETPRAILDFGINFQNYSLFIFDPKIFSQFETVYLDYFRYAISDRCIPQYDKNELIAARLPFVRPMLTGSGFQTIYDLDKLFQSNLVMEVLASTHANKPMTITAAAIRYPSEGEEQKLLISPLKTYKVYRPEDQAIVTQWLQSKPQSQKVRFIESSNYDLFNKLLESERVQAPYVSLLYTSELNPVLTPGRSSIGKFSIPKNLSKKLKLLGPETPTLDQFEINRIGNKIGLTMKFNYLEEAPRRWFNFPRKIHYVPSYENETFSKENADLAELILTQSRLGSYNLLNRPSPDGL